VQKSIGDGVNISPLFEPLKIGRVTLRNRLAFAPCTRQRSDLDGTPNDLNVEYYRQRAGIGLIVTEGVYPDDMGKGYLFSPGLSQESHVRGWRKVTEAVHAEGGAIFAQVMHVGRLSDPLMLPGGATPISASAVRPDPTARHYTTNCPRPKRPYPTPRALSTAEVHDAIDQFKRCAQMAVRAGFDGVEIHAASGYLPMQFLTPNTNQRDDEFGGNVEKRAHFLLSCVDAMSEVAGSEFVAVKVSPGWTFHDVFDDDPAKTYAYVGSQLSKRDIAYLQVGDFNQNWGGAGNSNQGWNVFGTMREVFDGPMMAVVGFTRARAAQMLADKGADFIGLGQAVMANPDLDRRYANGWALERPRLDYYYTQGAEGYTDYPVYEESPLTHVVGVDDYPGGI
jgi:N-ethylmaleimide reductase